LKTELNYLGHVVTGEGVKPDPNKVRAIKEFPVPKNVTDVKSFLGLAGYYRKFIPQFSKITKPLNDLLKKDKAWIWGENQIDSFHKLQTILTQEPVLQYPDFTKPFVLTCDASNCTVGAILSQGEMAKTSQSLSQVEL
jgi:hypothetical protein